MPNPNIKRTGLTPDERLIVDAVVSAWNHFLALDVTADDARDFRDAVHTIQRLMAVRAMRREYPEYWRSVE